MRSPPPLPPGAALAGPEVLSPRSYEEMAEMVCEAESSGRWLLPSGLGNHLDFAGQARRAPAVLSLEKLGKVLRYEPEDFTIGLQAGMPLDALKATLDENRQEIPLDFPRAPRGTIGGALAQNRHGPRRGRYGTLRPYLIGVVGMRGGGRIYKAGGMVVKNVAGYDVMKLLIGSRGTLGPILEANFKLRPLPAARSARRARFETAREAWSLVRALREAALDPAVLSVLNPRAAEGLEEALEAAPRAAWTVLWSFEGNAGAVRWLEGEVDRLLAEVRPTEVATLEEEGRAAALEFLAGAREVEPSSRETAVIISLEALPSRGCEVQEALDVALRAVAGARSSGGWAIADGASGEHLARLPVEAGAGQRPPEAANKLFELAAEIARRLYGNGEVLSAPASLAGRVLLPDPDTALSERIRRAFDPRGIFGPAPPEVPGA